MSDGGIRGAGNSPIKTKASGTWGVNEVHDARLKDLWPTMPSATQFYVGSFTKQNTTGTQAVTGVGFTPKAIIFWTSGSDAASGTWDSTIIMGMGFTDGTTSYAVAGNSFDAQPASATSRRIAAKAFTVINDSGDTAMAECDLSSFDADGFTLNWTTNSTNTFYDDQTICFLALGGSGVSAKVVNWTSPTATGNKAVTGVGFTPSVVLHATVSTPLSAGVPASDTSMVVGFGAMDSAGGQWMNSVAAPDAQDISNTDRYQRTNKCLGSVVVGIVAEEAEFVSMDSDGFTLNHTTVDSAGANNNISLCLSGVSAKAGSFNKTTDVAPASQPVTGTGFIPKALMLSSVNAVAGTAVVASSGWTLGASDGVNERATSQRDSDNEGTTQARSLFKNDKVIVNNALSSDAIQHEADLTSFDGDGFTLSWTTNNSVTREILYLALG